MLRELEEKFRVVYPDRNNATYSSVLNYSSEKNTPFQRWYRYKEGFSIDFVNRVVEEYLEDAKDGVLMDPFSGSGTTIVAANKLNMRGIGFEVNPFSYFLMQVKTDTYSQSDIDAFKETYTRIIEELSLKEYEHYILPSLSISHKVFASNVENVMMSGKVKIKNVDNLKVQRLLKLGWLSCLEIVSNYRKAGNGLKFRKLVKPIIYSDRDVISELSNQYNMMYEDLKMSNNSREYNKVDNIILNESCLNFAEKIKANNVRGIIFSPPYANCFDYTEIYKLELWFGDFVKEYDDLKLLRGQSLRSHLNRKYDEALNTSYKYADEVVEHFVKKIDVDKIWDKKIPKMINGYFTDMFNVIDNCYKVLERKGLCAIVVGNSAYGGTVIPTDLVLANYASKVGFTVDKIDVNRYIITSSQQYKQTLNDGKFLRESVVCLVKPE